MIKKDFFLILPIYLISFTYLPSLYVFGAPQGIISPGCGPMGDFGISMNVNGFFPNSFVGWDFLGPDGARTMHGYFATNSTGGFGEDAEVEALMNGEHILLLYDDLNHDYSVDQNGNMANATILIPCR
jgi:hypothetical protein